MLHETALHIFRRDLRLVDNTALLYALRNANSVIPCFILDPRQIEPHEYRADNAAMFMRGCLLELDEELRRKGSRLFLFRGQAEDVVAELLSKHGISLVTLNRDYTPFAQRRDAAIAAACRTGGADFACPADALLTEPESVHKDDGTPYVVFSAFYRRAQKIRVSPVRRNHSSNFAAAGLTMPDEQPQSTLTDALTNPNPNLRLTGGRKEALRLLHRCVELMEYETERDFPAESYTSYLSAHNKFGTLSIREVFYRLLETFGEGHGIISELYWRDFFTHIGYHFPHVFGQSFYRKFDAIEWPEAGERFDAWCSGQTGVPIVDAGMRELTSTGYMHNRVRMITASFLVKDLHIDWRRGEKFFARHLIDYDPCVNNGNWQWAASTGCDAQPYFRIFNPWRQQKRFDAECEYIKRWVPELEHLAPSQIQALDSRRPSPSPAYPHPVVDHKPAARYAKEIYAAAGKNSDRSDGEETDNEWLG